MTVVPGRSGDRYSLKIQLAPGPKGRVTRRLAPGLTEAQAEARDAAIARLVPRMRASLSADLLERLVDDLCAAPDEQRFAAQVTYIETRVLTGKKRPRAELVTLESLGKQWTSGDLAKKYPDSVVEKTDRSAAHAARYLSIYVYPLIGPRPIESVKLDDLEQVMAELPPHLSPATRVYVVKLLARLLEIAKYPLRLIEHNPMPRGFGPTLPHVSFVSLYQAEEARLVSCPLVPWLHRAFYGVLAREGFRVEECASLTWDQLDLAAGTVRLDWSKTVRHTGSRFWLLGADTVRVLARIKEEFPDSKGPFLTIATSILPRRLRSHLERAGVDRHELHHGGPGRRMMRAHDLRATFVTVALACGRTEVWVCDRTGHTSSAMLARYRRAARTIAELGAAWFVDLYAALFPEPVHTPSAPGTAMQNLPASSDTREV